MRTAALRLDSGCTWAAGLVQADSFVQSGCCRSNENHRIVLTSPGQPAAHTAFPRSVEASAVVTHSVRPIAARMLSIALN